MRSQGKYHCTIKRVVRQLQQHGALESLGVPRWSGSDALVLMMHERREVRRGRTEFLCDKSAAMPLCLPQIPHGLLGSNLVRSGVWQLEVWWGMLVRLSRRILCGQLLALDRWLVFWVQMIWRLTVLLYAALIRRVTVSSALPYLWFSWSYKCTFSFIVVLCCVRVCVICVVFI